MVGATKRKNLIYNAMLRSYITHFSGQIYIWINYRDLDYVIKNQNENSWKIYKMD